MSSFFDDASLVVIPSGYKDGKVYSVKPTSGAGDLTFTRNSNATRVNADGLVEKVRTNSLLQSNSFDTTWTPTSATITGGQADKDGGSNAWLLDKSNSGGRIAQTITSVSGVYTASFYAKEGTDSWCRILMNMGGSNPQAYFDLGIGAVGITADNIDATIESVGAGWYRCSVSGNVSGLTEVRYFVADGDGDISGTSGNIYIQDAQLEQGLVATDYIETTTTAMSEFAGVTASSVADVPRLDYSGGASCPSLLLEPQRTNNLPYSEYPSAWDVKSNISIQSNEGTSPEGVLNASNIYPTATGASFLYQTLVYTSGNAYTYSVFAKANGKDYLQIATSGASWTSNVWCTFDLELGATDNNGFESVGIEDYGNGWYRCYVKETAISTSSSRIVIGLVGNANAGRLSSITANGTDGVLIYGVVSEAGSYPTSYIPTYGTTVTRLADSTYVQNLITNGVTTSGGAYTIFFDLSNEPVLNVADGNSEFITLYSGQNLSTATISPRKYYNEADGKIRFYSNVDASNIGYVTSTNKKYAMSVNNNVVKLYSDGALQLTYTGTGNHNTLGSYRLAYGASNRTQAQFSQYIVFDSVLSDTECENLTA